jgi:hypothetical protein
MAYSFATSCPLSARMRRELAEQYLSLGFVGKESILCPWPALHALEASIQASTRIDRRIDSLNAHKNILMQFLRV